MATQVGNASSSSQAAPQQEEIDIKRKYLVREIIKTEHEYVKDLHTFVEEIMKPLGQKKDFLTGDMLVPPKMMSAIFSNIVQIKAVNDELWKNFEGKEESEIGLNIGKTFIEYADYFKIYTQYCANQPNAERTVELLLQNSQFDSYLEEKRWTIPECRELTFQSFLVKPMQRMCKYPLLLKELIKYTRDSHPDKNNLLLALEKLTWVVTDINENKRRFETQAKLISLQSRIEFRNNPDPPPFDFFNNPSRSFMMEAEFKKIVYNKKPFKGFLILFNDCLLICKYTKLHKLVYRLHIFLSSCLVLDGYGVGSGLVPTPRGPKKKKEDMLFSIVQPSNDDHVAVFCSNEEEKQEWIRAIKTGLMKAPSSIGNGPELISSTNHLSGKS